MPDKDAPGGSAAEMLAALMNSQELALARLSRILHDEIGQVLSAAGLRLDVLRMDLAAKVPEIEAGTREIQQLLEKAIVQVRSLSYELNPAIVERAGLQFALERLVGRRRDSFEGSIRLLYDPALRPPVEIASALYKIAEQALDNAIRHSGSSQIEVVVKLTQKTITLEVRDRGAGFAVEETARRGRGVGLVLMSHYASRAGLELSILSTQGEGTVVRAACRVAGPAAASNAVRTRSPNGDGPKR